MVYKLLQEPSGEYEKDGVRYTLLEAQWEIVSPEGVNIDCYFFDSREEAEKFFGITKVEQNNENSGT